MEKNNKLLKNIQSNIKKSSNKRVVTEESLKILKKISEEENQIALDNFPHGFHSIYSPLHDSNYWVE